jgi:hypothetical protein
VQAIWAKLGHSKAHEPKVSMAWSALDVEGDECPRLDK